MNSSKRNDINCVRYVFLFLLVPVFPFIGLSQIQGTIHDNNNEPISLANVFLINQKDNSEVMRIIASDEGTFSITNFKPGNYLIKTSMLGFKTTFSEPFEITSSNEHIHLTPIIVSEDTQQLGDVNIVAKKPIYEQQIDRLVVNVENSITSSGTTALEVLEKSPGVIVNRQNKTLSLGGKEGVLVLINGKESRMPAAAAIEMLNSMSSENIKKIELITTPPAKYEAEGNAGIINIVLKKDDDFGTNGTYTLGGGLGVDGKLNSSLTMNHHVEKVNIYGLYSYSYDNTYQEIELSRRINLNGSVNDMNSISRREPVTTFQNARLGFDYTITSKTTLGLLASGYTSDWEMDARNNITYKTDHQLTSLVDQQIVESNIWHHYLGNLNLQHSFKEDEFLELNVDYLHYDDNNPSTYFIQYNDKNNQPTSTENIDVTKKTPINTLVGKLDYSMTFGKDKKLEAGLKSSSTNFENNVGVANQINGNRIFNPELTNKNTLYENISAAYSSLNYKFNEKTSMIAGLRYEYTNTVLSTVSQHGIIDRHYGKLFPTLFLSRELNKNNKLQFAYSRRITRPSFNELAPFIIFQSPDTYIAGNEKLQPSISNILKTDYKYKSVLFSFTYSKEDNAIRRFQPRQDAVKNILYLTSKNLDNVTTATILLSFPITLTKWWNIQTNLNSIHQNVRTNYDGEKLDINMKNFNVNIINNFKIVDGLTGELSGYYQSPYLFGIYRDNSESSIDIGLQKKSKNEKHTFTLNISDVFKGNIYIFSVNVPALNMQNTGKLDFEPRVLRFTYAYNFGSKKVKSERQRETGSEEERKRVQ